MVTFDEKGKRLPAVQGEEERFRLAKVINAEEISKEPNVAVAETGFAKIVSNLKGHWNHPEREIIGKARVAIGAIIVPASLLASAAGDVIGEKKVSDTGQEQDRSVIKPLLKTASAFGIATLALHGGASKLVR